MPDILHIDMDCFFAAVEVKDNPDLAGKPVIVGALPGSRGVVSACNYEAREYGIHSAMPISRAFKKCPDGVYLPPNGKRYVEESDIIKGVFLDFTPLVEPISLDEAFLDVSGSHRMYGTSIEIGHAIKKRILDVTGLVASVGIAPSKFVAKIASDLEKPDGFVIVQDNEVDDFLEPLDVRKIWGVGKQTNKSLDKLGIHTIGDVRRYPEDEFVRIFGKHGQHLHSLAQGIDDRSVNPETERKQIGAEHTFGEDQSDMAEVERIFLALADKISSRMIKKGRRGKRITIKLRDETFKTVTRCRTLDRRIMSTDDIYTHALEIFRKEKLAGKKVRLVGISISAFEEEEQTSLFAAVEDDQQPEKIAQLVDNIRGKFGKASITRASLIGLKRKGRPEREDDDINDKCDDDESNDAYDRSEF